EEKRDLLPLVQKPGNKTVRPWAASGLSPRQTIGSFRRLTWHKVVGHRVVPGAIQGQAARAQENFEADTVQNAKRQNLLDVPRRRVQRFVVRQRARSGKIQRIGQYFRDQAAE